MVVCASPVTYEKLIDYGVNKAKLRVDRLLLQSIMAGIFVGMCGHASTGAAGGYETDVMHPLAVSPVTQKLIYAMIFPTAFICIIMTGAELFTGNTMTMLICLFERRATFLQLLRVWTCSLVGNFCGALFAAYFLSYLPNSLSSHTYLEFMYKTATGKTTMGWGETFLRGVGCNMFVCLAVWFVTACDDGAGKILATWGPIVCFVMAGYEHIVANFYTIPAAMMYGAPVTVGNCILYNFLPVLLGNVVGGAGLIGSVYWYNFYPVLSTMNLNRRASTQLESKHSLTEPQAAPAEHDAEAAKLEYQRHRKTLRRTLSQGSQGPGNSKTELTLRGSRQVSFGTTTDSRLGFYRAGSAGALVGPTREEDDMSRRRSEMEEGNAGLSSVPEGNAPSDIKLEHTPPVTTTKTFLNLFGRGRNA
eukprot:GHVT01028483.1.p1 GENE.GHVT01028483.1~~GHVT01028483.1.p1  ORF type:complete len:418 (-),score=52.77 GHVT01028483.1:918-2171(-)